MLQSHGHDTVKRQRLELIWIAPASQFGQRERQMQHAASRLARSCARAKLVVMGGTLTLPVWLVVIAGVLAGWANVLGEFEALVDELLPALSATNAVAVRDAVSAFMDIRGYGPVKDEAVADVRERISEIRSRIAG